LLQRHLRWMRFAASGELPPVKAPGRAQAARGVHWWWPASLACAAQVVAGGREATVIDRRELPGGLNTYGVAEYKLRAAREPCAK
jgi:dihydropyrimidine dehydrogenase (NAD+) subunit PreT